MNRLQCHNQALYPFDSKVQGSNPAAAREYEYLQKMLDKNDSACGMSEFSEFPAQSHRPRLFGLRLKSMS